MSVIAIAGLALLLLCAAESVPNDKPPNMSASTSQAATPEWLARLELANRLAEVAEADRDPLGLLAAARLRLSVGFKGDADSDTAHLATTGRASAWIARAEVLSDGDQDIRRVAARLRASRGRGIENAGPSMLIGTAGALARRSYTFEFRGGELALLYLYGSEGGTLDLSVYDDGGHLICAGTRSGNSAVCRWTPLRTGPFRIEVDNRSPSSSRYELATN